LVVWKHPAKRFIKATHEKQATIINDIMVMFINMADDPIISTHVRSRQDDKGDYADLTNPTFYALRRAMSWLHSLILA
jgi:hypothetical protein